MHIARKLYYTRNIAEYIHTDPSLVLLYIHLSSRSDKRTHNKEKKAISLVGRYNRIGSPHRQNARFLYYFHRVFNIKVCIETTCTKYCDVKGKQISSLRASTYTEVNTMQGCETHKSFLVQSLLPCDLAWPRCPAISDIPRDPARTLFIPQSYDAYRDCFKS